MSPEVSFLVTAWLIVVVFGLKLLFGGTAGTGMDRQWKKSEEVGILATCNRFTQGLGWQISPWLLITVILLLSVMIFLLFLELFPDRYLPAIMAALAFIVASLGLVRDLTNLRSRRFESQLVDAIDMMVPELRVGGNTLTALRRTADTENGIVKKEFAEAVRRLEFGVPIENSLKRMTEIYDSEGVRLFCKTLESKWHIGGDLASILSSVNVIIRERLKLRMQMIGQLSGIRYASFLLAAAPYVIYTFFMINQPDWIAVIHQDPLGNQMLYGALALQVAGMLILNWIFNSEL